MPCACKKRAKQLQTDTYMYQPSQGIFKPVTAKSTISKLQKVQEQQDPSPAQVYFTQLLQSSDSQYDFILTSDSSAYAFAATTKAQQACTLCAAKHLSFASVLLQSSREYDVCVAAGQVNLAASHYKEVSRELFEHCEKLAMYIVYNIRQPMSVIPYVTNLLEFISGDTTQLDEIPMQDVHEQMQAFGYAATVVDIASAFSLLFTEVDYLELNKKYAVGYLVRAATSPGAFVIPRDSDLQRYLISKLRQAWKIAQQMQQDSDMYYDCRQRLLVLLHNYVGLYILSRDAKVIRRRLHLPMGPVSSWLDMSDAQLQHNFIYSARRQRKSYFNVQLSDSSAS